MGFKLTIHRKRNTPENYWFKSFQYNSNIIEDIVDPSGGNIDKLLAAVPSPFARMHLFDSAFSLALKNIDSASETVFDKMVSECFDLFELLFNYQLHKKSGEKLSISCWDFETHINNLESSIKIEHKQLAEVLTKYILSNQKLKKSKTIYLFLLEGNVFGGTSPFTGCFTKPDIKEFSVKKGNGRAYFSQIVPLWKRDSDFLITLYSLFSPVKNSQFIQSAENVYRYLEKAVTFIQDNTLRSDLQKLINNTPITRETTFTFLSDDNNSRINICGAEIPTKNPEDKHLIDSPLEINATHLPAYTNNIKPLVLRNGRDHLDQSKADIKIPTNKGYIKNISERTLPDNNRMYPYLVVDDFLEDYLIRLNYPVNYQSFLIPKFDGFNKEENQGFLFPIKKEYFDFFTAEDLKENCTIIKKSEEGFSVELNIPIKGGQKVIFKKYYYLDPKGNDTGKLITANIYLSFYPLFKVIDNDNYNDFYKVMLVDDEVSVDKEVELVFYDRNFQEFVYEKNALIKVSKQIRSKKAQKSTNTSRTYYQLNAPFNFISVHIPTLDSSYANSIIVPVWKNIKLGNNRFDVAVDFGTTNSFVAIREQDSKIPVSLKVGENDLQNVLFNLPRLDNRLNMTDRFHALESTINDRLINKIEHEFIPSIIGDGTDPTFYFPIRTAISEAQDYNEVNSSILGNINISFVYDKDRIRPDEKITTDLKWSITNDKNRKRIEELLRELLIIVRNKILLNFGDPAITRLIWFKPLSMDNYAQNEYEIIWHHIFSEIFRTQQFTQITSLTESAAPYYFFNSIDKAYGELPILSIDIGGGSTDISFFINNVPRFGTSFNFAGNAIWKPNINRSYDTSNNFYKHYGVYLENKRKQFASANRIDDIQRLIAICESHTGGKSLWHEDLIELLFGWDKKIEFIDHLKTDPIIKFLILFHFSSIIYHSMQLLKNEGLDIPEYICLSGRGSNYLNVLDSSKDKRAINEYITNFIGDIFNNKNIHLVKLVTEDLSKEATCIGGLYMLADYQENIRNHDTTKSKVYYGEKTPNWSTHVNKLLYNDISEELKSEVGENVAFFIDLFMNQNIKFSFANNFGIKLNFTYDSLNLLMKQNINKYLALGLEKRLNRSKDKKNEEISETLFFYPLVQLINELTSLLYEEKS